MNQEKNTIRKEVLARRSSLSKEEINDAAAKALKCLLEMESYQKAETVMLYMDFRNEVPTGKLIQEVLTSGRRLVLPLTDKRFCIIPYLMTPIEGSIHHLLIRSDFGIDEPDPSKCKEIDPREIDLVLVPGAAFDSDRNRIGYGKGCYDRFLPLLREDAVKIALAYYFQVMDQVPASLSDIKMDGILIV